MEWTPGGASWIHFFAFGPPRLSPRARLHSMQNLAAYLLERLPEGMDYEDAAQLCIRLFVHVTGVPEIFLPLTKERLGDAFAELSSAGWVHQDFKAAQLSGFRYGAHLEDLSTREHWIKVMRSILLNPDLYERKRGETIATNVGFVSQKRGECAATLGRPKP